MKRAYKYRFYPTSEQVELLANTFGCVRFVYNSILRWRTDAYYERKEKISYIQANARLTALKKETDVQWLNSVSCVPLQQVLRHQQAAFSNFFSGRAKYPTFKTKHHKQSAEFTASAFKYRDGKLYIAKSKEPLDIRWSRELPSAPSTVTISKDASGRYFASCLCEFEPISLPVSEKMTGIDIGLKDLFVTDTGLKTGNPRHTTKYSETISFTTTPFEQKKKGSNNRTKARLKVAKLHAKITDCRLDNLHKLSHRLINENQVVCVESLKVKNMIRNPKLSKAIADASWGEFVRQIEYKANWYGRTIVAIDQCFPSSKRCSDCGYTLSKLALNIRSWRCPECGVNHDRDINAAKT
ncbi:RNA-guided endonuclease InsQ/TnpB family protein [Arsenophonus apicola]|uniref:RNA-guided endonuclease InsQ/TnpB family protein n=1 Tax=Arsenophonus apicola TaxID=2879119 RepID=UPI0035BF672E